MRSVFKPFKLAETAITLGALFAFPAHFAFAATCDVPLAPGWTDAENWAWEKICAGEIADLALFPNGSAQQFEDTEDDSESREESESEPCLVSRQKVVARQSCARLLPELRSEFLLSIIDSREAQHSLSRKGVHIKNARITGDLVLQDARLSRDLLIFDSIFAGIVDLTRLTTTSSVFIERSTFEEAVIVESIEVEKHLMLRSSEFKKHLDVHSSNVGGRLSMNCAVFRGGVNANYISVGDSWFVRYATIQVEDNRSEPFTAMYASVEHNFDIRGGNDLPSMNLTGSRFGSEFRVASNGEEKHRTTWLPRAKLNLRNVETKAIVDTVVGWPDELDLEGFRYQALTGNASPNNQRDSSWYKGWLEKGHSLCPANFSPEPYRRLSSLLLSQGRTDLANEIEYEARMGKKEVACRNQSWDSSFGWQNFFRCNTQRALQFLIGYGIGFGYFLAALPALGLVLIGMFVLWKQEQLNTVLERLIFSLDKLLPIIRLRGEVGKPELSRFGRWYFLFHQIAGFILASFIVAGLSGIASG